MLDQLMAVRGVRQAAIIDAEGRVLTHMGEQPDPSLVAAGRAVATSMLRALGSGEFRDMVIDFEDGPVLLTSVGDKTVLTGFDDVANLGRLRFAVKRATASLRRP